MTFPPEIKEEKDQINRTGNDGHDIGVVLSSENAPAVIADCCRNKIASKCSFIVRQPSSFDIYVNPNSLDDGQDQEKPDNSSLKLNKEIRP
jgi:hypothetical protein